jgi:gluconokinase
MDEQVASRPPLVVVMGVAGSGKTTVGHALAERLGVDFADADDFHSEASIAKMASGHPLDDDDRAPWLVAIGGWLADHDEKGGVVGCSALRQDCWVADRPGHFMPASLITSQLETLEPLEGDELGRAADLTTPVDDIVDDFLTRLNPTGERP